MTNEMAEKDAELVELRHLLASAQERVRFLEEFWRYQELLRQRVGVPHADGLIIYEIRFTTYPVDLGEYFMVLKAFHEGQFLIGFHSSLGLWGTAQSVVPRLRNGTLVWRTDEFPGDKSRKEKK